MLGVSPAQAAPSCGAEHPPGAYCAKKGQADYFVSLAPAAVNCERDGDLSASPAYETLVAERPDLSLSAAVAWGGKKMRTCLMTAVLGLAVSQLRTSEAGAADTGSPPPGREADPGERALTFAGAALAAVYVPGAGEGELRLVETAGRAVSQYGLPEHLPLSGGSPAAEAFRTDRPLWLDHAALASYEGGPTPPRAQTSLGAVSLGAEGRRLGCLVVVGDSAEGFEAGQRRFLEQYAEAVSDLLQAGTDRPASPSLLIRALRELRVGSFVLVPDSRRHRRGRDAPRTARHHARRLRRQGGHAPRERGSRGHARADVGPGTVHPGVRPAGAGVPCPPPHG